MTAAPARCSLTTPIGSPGRALRPHPPVVALARHKLDLCRQRVQQDTLRHRGRSGDPLCRMGLTLRTRLGLLIERQRARLETVFEFEEHVAVEATWWVDQQSSPPTNTVTALAGRSC